MAVKNFLLIRHGKTQSNLERRYIGDPEEPLCEIGLAEAKQKSGTLPLAARVLCGPALRCRQTARILFPDMPYTLCPMSEMDFGVFKGKNAAELTGDAAYESWLATDCMGDIPGGGSVAEFKKLCCVNFLRVAEESGEGTTALVIHGGNIMAIMEGLAQPKKNFYDYHIPNCGHVLCRYENGTLFPETVA